MIKLKISRVKLNRADHKPNELFFPALPMCSLFALATGKKKQWSGDVRMCGCQVARVAQRLVGLSIDP
jgi:hypothetical protein